jgi:DNA-binding response OmpR family regulator
MTATRDVGVSSAHLLIGAEVLVIDKDPSVREGMQRLFAGGDLHVTSVDDPAAAWELFEQRFFSVVVLDLDTPQPGGAIDTIEAVALKSPTSAIVVLTPRRSFDDAVAAVRAGAVDVIVKAPDAIGYLVDRIKEAAARSLARRQQRATLAEVRAFHDDVLRSFMEIERKNHELEAKLAGRSIHASLGAELTVLVVAEDAALFDALVAGRSKGFRFVAAHSGGEALDRASTDAPNLALVSDALSDLPASMVVRSLKGAHPEALVALVSGPRPGGKVEVIEGDRPIPVINDFVDAAMLVGQLDELAEATRARERERRFLQAFRERHYALLRRLATLKQRLESE